MGMDRPCDVVDGVATFVMLNISFSLGDAGVNALLTPSPATGQNNPSFLTAGAGASMAGEYEVKSGATRSKAERPQALSGSDWFGVFESSVC